MFVRRFGISDQLLALLEKLADNLLDLNNQNCHSTIISCIAFLIILETIMNLAESVACQRNFELIKIFFICWHHVWLNNDTSSGMDKREQLLCSREFWQIIVLAIMPIDNRLDFHQRQQPYERKIAGLLSLTHARRWFG